MYTQVKDLPETIQSALNSLGYGRKDISLEVAESISPAVSGGQGKRGFCCIVNIETGERKIDMGSWGGANCFGPSAVNPVDSDRNDYVIPPNFAVIKGSEGGDRPVYATITISSSNMIKALPEKVELSARDQWLLYTFKGLTSAGRKNEWERCNDKPSEADLVRFAINGWIKRRSDGACMITTEGKNTLLASDGGSYSVPHPSRR